MALTTLVAGQVIRASTLNANFALCVLTDTARTVTVTHTYTASQTFSGGWTAAAACTVTVASASALAVGRQGATDPAFLVHSSTASQATGIQVTGKAAASGAAIAVISSGTNENLTIDAKGSGTVTLGGTSTGAITLARATTISAALTYGGVTLSNAVTGTGNMVLSAGPTFTGTITAAIANFSGAVTQTSTAGFTNDSPNGALFVADRGANTDSGRLQLRTAGVDDWQIGSIGALAPTSDLQVYSHGTSTVVLTIARASGNATFTGAIACGNTVNSVSPTSPNRTITMVIGGTTYYLHAKTTND